MPPARRLRPSPNTGILTNKKEVLHTGAPCKPLAIPSGALRRIDRIRKSTEQLKVLIGRHCGGIGDVLMTLPTVRQIRKEYNCKLDYATDFEYLNGALYKVLQGNPNIDNILDYRDLTQDIKDQTYDAVIDLTCPCIVHEQPGAPPINRIDLFARHAGVHLEDVSIDYYLTSQELTWAQEFLNSRGVKNNQLFMIAPHASTSRRDLPINILKRSVVEILKKKGTRGVVITHSTDERKDNWQLVNTIEMRDYDIRCIAAVMFYCDLVLCQDSAILHMAGALDKKTLSFFGPTDPHARVNYYPNAVALCPGYYLKCFPSWYSHQSCNNTFPCWKLFTEELVYSTALTILNNEPLPNRPEIIYYGTTQKKGAGLYEIL